MVLMSDRPIRPAVERPATAPGQLDAVLNASLDWPDLQRYRYFLWFASAATIEAAHVQAFDLFRPEDREVAYRALHRRLGSTDQWNPALAGTDPRTLASLVTRVELRRPGEVERALRRRTPDGTDLLAKLVSAVLWSPAGRSFFEEVADPAISH
ncbi:MAG: hypothetical protein KatS3mg060_0904 [Dehalococcoidia bacterium]|nr:MAG: hypothetical protein KatS3mg060_0904 [Dehalococcoidia bacterium]